VVRTKKWRTELRFNGFDDVANIRLAYAQLLCRCTKSAATRNGDDDGNMADQSSVYS